MATRLCQGVGMTTLTMQDEKRIEIIQRVFRDELTLVKAAMVLGISAPAFSTLTFSRCRYPDTLTLLRYALFSHTNHGSSHHKGLRASRLEIMELVKIVRA